MTSKSVEISSAFFQDILTFRRRDQGALSSAPGKLEFRATFSQDFVCYFQFIEIRWT